MISRKSFHNLKDLLFKITHKYHLIPEFGVGISEVALGDIIPLPAVRLEEGILPFQGQKTLQVPANDLSSAGDKGKTRALITWSVLFTGTCHRFHTLCRWGTIFLGQKALVRALQTSNPEVAAPLRFGGLNPSQEPNLKHRRAGCPGLLGCEGFLNSSRCEIPVQDERVVCHHFIPTTKMVGH